MSNDEERLIEAAQTVYDVLRFVKDPEKDATLEELNVLQEDKIKVTAIPDSDKVCISLTFVPTVPHCSLATLIGLCLRVKLRRELPFPYRLTILVEEGSHDTAAEVSKQINDKERVAAALENPVLLRTVDDCVNAE